MKQKYFLPVCALLLLCLSFARCKKHHDAPLTELEKLPPITQTGANTFGCLLNGQAWIPKDRYGQATFHMDVDPTFQNGVFGVSAIRYYADGKFQSISIGSDSCTNGGIYLLPYIHTRAQYADYGISIIISSWNTGTTCTGNLNITRYDLQNRIFSGTFEYTIYRTGTDTMRITNGRFDAKL